MTDPSLADTIRQRLGEFPPSERKVARVLLATYPTAGLETSARLAERAATSAPTVIRFVNRLGFNGFPEFQQALRTELEQRDASPLTLYSEPCSEGAALLQQSAEVFGHAVHRTLTALPPDDLRAAVELLGESRRVHVTGGRFTGLFAHYLLMHLVQLRDNAFLLPEATVERAASLAGLGKRDVLVVFDYRRYEPQHLALARMARQKNCKIILFTDTWLSPVASLANVVLPSQLDAPSPYDSLVPTVAVVETVVAALLTALGESAHQRMLACEAAANQSDLY
ncbi:MurR/RpiR family transcriptional regulator [Nocardia yunnanensis]|uniref:MurR/RpiR family transcriptional regulator n=1 Tax=Nocardia yunnanensis TaxID=2382165 RepID=A0A386ZMT4_9NOCA|nr:MurR/RpiR family transcriptional regulator [Nocardia yunnanensis]AYF79122.1 MurR/RpiR family transcriptional regulator [Nocardia yunnanensis]